MIRNERSWIKMRLNLHKEPEVIAMSGQLNMDKFSVIGRLYRVWALADEHLLPDGSVRGGLTDEIIDDKVGCHGFSLAMASVGWRLAGMTPNEVAAWQRHNGDSAKARAGGAVRKRLQRSKDVGSLPLIPDKVQPQTVRITEKKKEPEPLIPLTAAPVRMDVRLEASSTSELGAASLRELHASEREAAAIAKCARPDSIEDALAFGLAKPGYTEEAISVWFHSRNSQGWLKSNGHPITNWRSDMDAWVLTDGRRQIENSRRSDALMQLSIIFCVSSALIGAGVTLVARPGMYFCS